MKIIDTRCGKEPKTVTLNEIPVGAVFSGNVHAKNSNTWTRGIFYKADGGVSIFYTADGGVFEENTTLHDVVVVRLDETKFDGYANLWTDCSEVRDYVLLDVELKIKGEKL